jgi:VWFA-related protein
MTRGPCAVGGPLILSVACLAWLAGAGPAGAQRAAERGLDLLTVDFLAVGATGRPVPDLRPEEVTLKVDGQARSIRTLQLITVAPGSSGGGAPPAIPLPPPYGTNTASEAGRTAVIVLDDQSLPPGREGPLREAASRFLSRLAPRDRVGLVTMPYGGVKSHLTTDHGRIREVLAGLAGQAPTAETGSDLACRSRRTLEALADFFRGLAPGEAPRVVIFVTSALAAPRRDAPIMLAPGMCELTTDDFQHVGTAVGAAHAHLYVVQTEDPQLTPGEALTENIAGVGFTGPTNPLAGIEHLAGVTGAHRLHLAAGPGALERVTHETSAYYLASFEPARSDRNGQSHQLEVRVAREGVETRSWPAVTFPRTDARRQPVPETPRQMLAVATVFRDLPLRVAGYASEPSEDGKLKVVSIVESSDPSASLSAAVVALIDANGRLVAQWTASADDLARVPVVAAMRVAPGRYRLRAAAVDGAGRRGTADEHLFTELTPAGSLSLSSIILGLLRDGAFVPRLQFSAEPVAMAYLELYGGVPGAPVSAVLELATTLNGPAAVTVPLAIGPTADAGRYRATAALPIGNLPDGDYIVRAIVGIEGQAAGRVTRTLRKVANGGAP